MKYLNSGIVGMRLVLFPLTVILLAATSLSADDSLCRFSESAIHVDGRLDEPAWPAAPAGSAGQFIWARSHLYAAINVNQSAAKQIALWIKPSPHHSGIWRIDVSADGSTQLKLYTDEDDAVRIIPEIPGLRIEASRTNADVEQLSSNTLVEISVPWLVFSATGGRPTADEAWQYSIATASEAEVLQRPSLELFRTLRFLHPENSSQGAYGISERIPLKTSRVVGSPDPPKPYRAVRVWENLKVNWPVFAVAEPGTRRMLFIDQPGPYSLTRITRTVGELTDGQHETLLDNQYSAYSICFHPRFAENGYIYIGNNGGTPKHTRVTRYTMRREPPYEIEPGSERTIIEWPSDGHNGAAVAFGTDGMLYVTSGDGTSDSDTNLMGQGLDHLLSKVLRIDVDNVADNQRYRVPSDNPFVSQPDVRPETWSYGLRNPWRMAVDPKTGDIWVGNNGQDLWEQIYLIQRGANYGWSVYEGSHPFYLNRQLGPHPLTPPTFEHPHSEARSLTGGVVYHGSKLPELAGAYLYGDYSTGKIWGAKVVGGKIEWHRELADTTLQITAIAIDPDGELLIADHRQDGGFYTLEKNDATNQSQSFPRRLNETGLFQSVKNHVVDPALIPYSVNSPLWSDGADKMRFIAVPESSGSEHAAPKIQFTSRGSWSFPEGTVLVKSFSLNTREGDPATRRWIETRLLTRQEGEWVGYTYLWNDEQTDAELVEAQGCDVTYEIETATGTRQQVWHYPSRTECMVCHSRAANFVLGLSTPQLNRVHDYGGQADNQLRVLEHLELLQTDFHQRALDELKSTWSDEGISKEDRATYEQALEQIAGQRPRVESPMLWKAPDEFARLADPYDAQAPLIERARSYLASNCAQCHVMAGGGNAQMDLDYFTPLDRTGLIDAKPLHHTFGIQDARIVAPGDPQRSVLIERLTRRGEGQMPQLATSQVDEQAVAMLKQWIESLQ